MTTETVAYTNGLIFNGVTLFQNHTVLFKGGQWNAMSAGGASDADTIIDLNGDILSPGYADLQVNGGGGVMLNDGPTVALLETIAKAHRLLGTTCFLPTLITDSPDKTSAAIEAVAQAIERGVAGITGLHLEGPHLSIEKKGAHEEQLIRPMTSVDLEQLLDAAAILPALKVTVAPENVTCEQVRTLAKAGIIVALGHTNASYDICKKFQRAGAHCVTHLYNAMSQLGLSLIHI